LVKVKVHPVATRWIPGPPETGLVTLLVTQSPFATVWTP
jgi:hypothetical protein